MQSLHAPALPDYLDRNRNNVDQLQSLASARLNPANLEPHRVLANDILTPPGEPRWDHRQGTAYWVAPTGSGQQGRTSYVREQTYVSSENLPWRFGFLEQPNNAETRKKHSATAAGPLVENGQDVLGSDGQPLRDLPILPRQISLGVESWRLWMWQLYDTRVTVRDIIQRQPRSQTGEISTGECRAITKRIGTYRERHGGFGTNKRAQKGTGDDWIPASHAECKIMDRIDPQDNRQPETPQNSQELRGRREEVRNRVYLNTIWDVETGPDAAGNQIPRGIRQPNNNFANTYHRLPVLQDRQCKRAVNAIRKRDQLAAKAERDNVANGWEGWGVKYPSRAWGRDNNQAQRLETMRTRSEAASAASSPAPSESGRNPFDGDVYPPQDEDADSHYPENRPQGHRQGRGFKAPRPNIETQDIPSAPPSRDSSPTRRRRTAAPTQGPSTRTRGGRARRGRAGATRLSQVTTPADDLFPSGLLPAPAPGLAPDLAQYGSAPTGLGPNFAAPLPPPSMASLAPSMRPPVAASRGRNPNVPGFASPYAAPSAGPPAAGFAPTAGPSVAPIQEVSIYEMAESSARFRPARGRAAAPAPRRAGGQPVRNEVDDFEANARWRYDTLIKGMLKLGGWQGLISADQEAARDIPDEVLRSYGQTRASLGIPDYRSEAIRPGFIGYNFQPMRRREDMTPPPPAGRAESDVLMDGASEPGGRLEHQQQQQQQAREGPQFSPAMLNTMAEGYPSVASSTWPAEVRQAVEQYISEQRSLLESIRRSPSIPDEVMGLNPPRAGATEITPETFAGLMQGAVEMGRYALRHGLYNDRDWRTARQNWMLDTSLNDARLFQNVITVSIVLREQFPNSVDIQTAIPQFDLLDDRILEEYGAFDYDQGFHPREQLRQTVVNLAAHYWPVLYGDPIWPAHAPSSQRAPSSGPDVIPLPGAFGPSRATQRQRNDRDARFHATRESPRRHIARVQRDYPVDIPRVAISPERQRRIRTQYPAAHFGPASDGQILAPPDTTQQAADNTLDPALAQHPPTNAPQPDAPQSDAAAAAPAAPQQPQPQPSSSSPPPSSHDSLFEGSLPPTTPPQQPAAAAAAAAPTPQSSSSSSSSSQRPGRQVSFAPPLGARHADALERAFVPQPPPPAAAAFARSLSDRSIGSPRQHNSRTGTYSREAVAAEPTEVAEGAGVVAEPEVVAEPTRGEEPTGEEEPGIPEEPAGEEAPKQTDEVEEKEYDGETAAATAEEMEGVRGGGDGEAASLAPIRAEDVFAPGHRGSFVTPRGRTLLTAMGVQQGSPGEPGPGQFDAEMAALEEAGGGRRRGSAYGLEGEGSIAEEDSDEEL